METKGLANQRTKLLASIHRCEEAKKAKDHARTRAEQTSFPFPNPQTVCFIVLQVGLQSPSGQGSNNGPTDFYLVSKQFIIRNIWAQVVNLEQTTTRQNKESRLHPNDAKDVDEDEQSYTSVPVSPKALVLVRYKALRGNPMIV